MRNVDEKFKPGQVIACLLDDGDWHAVVFKEMRPLSDDGGCMCCVRKIGSREKCYYVHLNDCQPLRNIEPGVFLTPPVQDAGRKREISARRFKRCAGLLAEELENRTGRPSVMWLDDALNAKDVQPAPA